MIKTAFDKPPDDGYQTIDVITQHHLDNSSIVIQRQRAPFIPDDKIQLKLGIKYIGKDGNTHWAGGPSILVDQLQEHINRVRTVWSKFCCRTRAGISYVIPEPSNDPNWEVLDSMKLSHLADGTLYIERNNGDKVPKDTLQLQISMSYGSNAERRGFSIQHHQIDDYIRRLEHILVLYGIVPMDPPVTGS